MSSALDYTYRVFWSAEDETFVATVAEFKSLSYVADSQEGALSGMVELVDFVLSDLREQGQAVPKPLGARRFSGHLPLRIPPAEHRRIAMEAAEEGVSINQLILSRI